MTESFNPGEFVNSLKQLTLGEVHSHIDQIHNDFLRQDTRNPAQVNATLARLQNVCGTELVSQALERAFKQPPSAHPGTADCREPAAKDPAHPPKRPASPAAALPTSHSQPGGDAKHPAKKTSCAEQPQSPPEISRAALDAWNHALDCKLLASEGGACQCEFPLCDQVRPSVLHRIETRSNGIAGKCLEGCKHCAFYLRMREATAEQGEKSRAARKFEDKKKKLIQLFAGLLLAHSQGQGSESIMALYAHVMCCEHPWPAQEASTRRTPSVRPGCPFRTADGSCRASMTILSHFRTCSFTKQCAMCSSLPPKLRRLKKTKKKMPKPVAIARVEAMQKSRRSRARGVKRQVALSSLVEEVSSPGSQGTALTASSLEAAEEGGFPSASSLFHGMQGFQLERRECSEDGLTAGRPIKRARGSSGAASGEKWSSEEDADIVMGSP